MRMSQSVSHCGALGKSHFGTVIRSCCRRRDGCAVLLVAAEAGQSAPSKPDRDTQSIIGVDPATDTHEDGVQSVKHVEFKPTVQVAVLLHGTLVCVDDTTLVGTVGWSSNVRGSMR